MAITTYSELQDAVANWLDRTDLTDRIPEFIALAEADINSQFSHRDVESTTTLTPTVDSRFIDLPTGFREPLNLWILWSGSAKYDELRALTPETMEVSTVSSVPAAWCIDGDYVAFDSPCNSASDYTFPFRWVGKIALSNSTTTNLVLTNYPNVYLFGALKEAAPYLRDPDALVMWSAKYEDAISKAKIKEGRSKTLTTLSTEPGMLTTDRPSFDVYRGY